MTEHLFAMIAGSLAVTAALGSAQDWPQFQHNAANHGRAAAPVEPPFQLRWVWYGPGNVARGGRPFPEGQVPRPPADSTAKLSFTMHAVVAGQRVFFGDLEGRAVCLDSRTGAELWIRRLPGAFLHAFGVCFGDGPDQRIVIAPCQDGTIYGLSWADGTTRWRVRGERPFVTPAKIDRGVAYMGGLDGTLYAIDAATGGLRWRFDAGAPIRQPCAIADGRVFFGSEDMIFHAVDAGSGRELWRTATGQLTGQSFRNTWPVVVGDKVMTFQVLVDGASEFVMETLLFNATPGDHRHKRLEDWPAERDAILAWLAGDMTWARDCQKSWQEDPGQPRGEPSVHHAGTPLRKTLYVFNAAGDGHGGAVEPYQVPMGVVGGTGNANMGPTLDARGRPLLWWRVSARSIITGSSFGTAFAPDISALDVNTGDRIILPTSRDIHAGGPGMELDNHHMLTSAGDYVYYFNPFRQARWVKLDGHTNPSGRISSAYRQHDGGGWPADVVYYPTKEAAGPRAARMYDSHGAARTPLVIADGALLANEIDIRALACYEPCGAAASAPRTDSRLSLRERTPFRGAKGDNAPKTALSNPQPDYVRQTLVVTDVADNPDTRRLRGMLAGHVRGMLDAGHLRPYFCKRGENNPRWYFTNPGDTVMALCRSYPHLPADLQAKIRTYLQREVAAYPPLSDTITTPDDDGTSRNLFEVPERLREFDADFYRRLPRAHNLYAVWLYARVTGDNVYVRQHWSAACDFARKHDADFDAYVGGAAGAIGWARLAPLAGDEEVQTAAETRARQALAAIGNEPALRRPMFERYGFRARWAGDFNFQGFHLLHLTPEVASFIRHHKPTHRSVLAHVDAAIDHWPMWFGSQASAFSRYYGESHALSPIYSKMIYPVQALVALAPPGQLTVWADAEDAPRGDLFFIERLVLAIEAHGRRQPAAAETRNARSPVAPKEGRKYNVVFRSGEERPFAE